MEILLNLCSGLIGAIIGVYIAYLLQNKSKKRQMKRELLTSILSYRFQLTENYTGSQMEIISLLNAVIIAYNSEAVLDALKRYWLDKKAASFIALLEAMFNEIGFKGSHAEIFDKILEAPFTSKRTINS